MRFGYQPFEAQPTPADPSPVIYRPAVLVRVRGLPGELDLWGILDTGAVECVLPFEVYEAVEAARRGDDVGNLVDAGGRHRVLEYGTVGVEVAIKGRPLRWSAKVAFDRGRADEASWGHLGFLQYFNATFNGPERHVTLRPRGDRPPPILGR
ncbi:hypothetical protein [Tautonia plasticadhaerens]|uniref:Peptidase A2 domain-containing protein n=1 Tax=Tautonia plasticadhaerens TaxID=2527974 RepID=A0A518HE47_9BACT|nr:hypothetical protein [Tautonia plasticadhaerens]QDV39130.1 hypothetical protein ElP_70940 [Tautonia plasticadhaerens]